MVGEGGGWTPWTPPLTRKHAPAWNVLKVGHNGVRSLQTYSPWVGEGGTEQTEPAACYDRWNEDNSNVWQLPGTADENCRVGRNKQKKWENKIIKRLKHT